MVCPPARSQHVLAKANIVTAFLLSLLVPTYSVVKNAGTTANLKAGLRIRMAPHSFSPLDPDPNSICGSGSRRGNLRKKRKKCTGNSFYLLNFVKYRYPVTFDQLACFFLLLRNLFSFFNYSQLFIRYRQFFTKFLKLDPPGSALRKQLDIDLH